ncbi:MAG: peptidylprolyl isomerase [Candidatus Zixiibacteriota bacterium]
MKPIVVSTVAGLFLIVAGSISSFADREIVDRIVAVVGDRIILASELDGQIQLVTFQSGRQPKTEQELQQLKQDILQKMVYDQLFLIAAQEDTSITVRPEEIDQALDDHIADIAQNFESNEKFLEALAAEGLTIRELKKQFHRDIENQILKQRYIQKKVSTVSVSRHEVEEFFARFKDSLPGQPEAVKLAHILIPIEPSQQVEDSVKALASQLRRKVLDGADFAAISAQYSSMGAGANGGDLGYVAKDDVVPEFARAAFNLSVGDISGVIRTQFGYHIIKCEGQKGDRLKLRHVLLAVQPSKQDTLQAIQLADSLLAEVRRGADFQKLAKIFSSDNETRAQGGELGWFATEQLPSEFASEVTGWKTPGEYKGPIYSQYGLHILKLLDYQPAREFTLKDDYDKIKELTRQEKTSKLIDKWISKIKETTFIEYRL